MGKRTRRAYAAKMRSLEGAEMTPKTHVRGPKIEGSPESDG